MKKEYDFSKAKKNPYARRLKRRVTIRLDGPTVDYFKGLAEETGIPYQTLINLYLRDCADSKRELTLEWRPESVRRADPAGRRLIPHSEDAVNREASGGHRHPSVYTPRICSRPVPRRCKAACL
jgi:hypothetical protein